MQEKTNGTEDKGRADTPVVLVLPGKNGRGRMLCFTKKKVLAAVAACVACVGVLAGAAGSLNGLIRILSVWRLL